MYRVSMTQALQRDEIALKFHRMTEKIEAALSQVRYEKLGFPEEVTEQVLSLLVT